MQGFNVLGAIILVLIIMNEAISACTVLKVEGSFMWIVIVCFTEQCTFF